MGSDDLADVIRGTHRQMREAMVSLLADGFDEEGAWEAIKAQFSEDIKDYAPVMHALGDSWRQDADGEISGTNTGTKNPEDHGHLPGRGCHSRWCLDTIREYYWGAAEGKGLVSLIAKDKKKEHWDCHGERLSTPLALQAAVNDARHVGSIFQPIELSVGDDMDGSPAKLFPVVPVRILDVGSCYNPLLQLIDEDCKAWSQGHSADGTSTGDCSKGSGTVVDDTIKKVQRRNAWRSREAEVVAIDLSPAVASVGRCDFVTVPVDASDESGLQSQDSSSQGCCGGESSEDIDSLPREFFHVVVFSLLLSYIPSPGHRFHCCVKAHDLLRNNGLFVVMTPRSTEPKWSHGCPTMKAWRREICSIGFQAWGPVVRLGDHIICLRFRKIDQQAGHSCGIDANKDSDDSNGATTAALWDSAENGHQRHDGIIQNNINGKLYIPADRINGLLTARSSPPSACNAP